MLETQTIMQTRLPQTEQSGFANILQISVLLLTLFLGVGLCFDQVCYRERTRENQEGADLMSPLLQQLPNQ